MVKLLLKNIELLENVSNVSNNIDVIKKLYADMEKLLTALKQKNVLNMVSRCPSLLDILTTKVVQRSWPKYLYVRPFDFPDLPYSGHS